MGRLLKNSARIWSGRIRLCVAFVDNCRALSAGGVSAEHASAHGGGDDSVTHRCLVEVRTAVEDLLGDTAAYIAQRLGFWQPRGQSGTCAGRIRSAGTAVQPGHTKAAGSPE